VMKSFMIEKQEVRRGGRRRTPPEIQKIVSEFKSGDLTQIEFYRRRGLILSTLGRYLSPGACLERGQQSWTGGGGVGAKKDGAEASGGCGLSVSVASGRRIVVEAGFDAATCSAWCKCWRGCRVFGIGRATRIYLAPGATNLRKGFEGLYGLVLDRFAVRAAQCQMR
jgi:hypothetical protein